MRCDRCWRSSCRYCTYRITYQLIPPAGTRSIPAFLDDARALLARLPEDADEAAGLETLAAQLERAGLEWNGTVCLVVRPD